MSPFLQKLLPQCETMNHEIHQLKLISYVMQSQRHVTVNIFACPDFSRKTIPWTVW